MSKACLTVEITNETIFDILKIIDPPLAELNFESVKNMFYILGGEKPELNNVLVTMDGIHKTVDHLTPGPALKTVRIHFKD